MRFASALLLLATMAAADDAAALARAIADPDPDVRLAAVEKLAILGPAAAPAVEALVDAAFDETREVRLAALRALRAVGPAAAAAVPALQELRGGTDQLVDLLATRALVAIGTGPRPALLEVLGSDAASLEDVAPKQRDAVVVALRSGDGRVVAQAAYVLRRIARGDASLQPELVRVLGHRRAAARWEANLTLVTLGARAAPSFVAELRHSDVRRRRLGALGLAGLAGAAVEALPPLVEALDDADPTVRRLALGAVGNMRGRAAPAVPRLIALLGDPAVQQEVLTTLLLIGPAAEDAVPAMAKMLAHADLAVRRKATETFYYAHLGATGKPAVPALVAACYDTDWAVASNAVRALSAIGPPAAAAAPYLAELGEADANIAGLTTEAIRRIGAGAPLPPPPQAEELDALVARLADLEKEEAGRAAFQLGRLRPQGGPALRALRRALGSPLPYVRTHAAFALLRVGAVALPTLADALENGGTAERQLASRVLVREALLPGFPLDTLVAALDDDDPVVRQNAASAVGTAGSKAARAVPALLRLAQGDEPTVANAATWSLGRVGADAGRAVPELTRLLADWEDQSRAAVLIGALGDIGPAARSSIPTIVAAAREGLAPANAAMQTLPKMGAPGEAALVDLIREGSGNLRAMAIETVQFRNLDPPGLRVALEAALQDPNERARTAAMRALERVSGDAPVDVAALMEGMRRVPLARYNQSQIPSMLAKRAAPDAIAPFVGDEDQRVRWCAWYALALKDAKQIPDALRAKLEAPALSAAATEKGWVQWAASGYLAKFPPASFSEGLLRCLADDKLKSLHPKLYEVARGLDGKARASVAAAVANADLDVKRGAAMVVRLYGAEGAPAVPALRRAFKEDPRHRYVYFQAILAIGVPALPVMLELYPGVSTYERGKLADAIGKLGAEALPALREALKTDDTKRRITLIGLLGGAGPEALPDLLRLVEDSNSSVRRAAIYQLGRMEADADAAVPALLAGLRSNDRNTVSAALDALRKLGPNARVGIEQAMRSDDAGVRRAALKAAPVLGDDALPLLARGLEDEDVAVRAEAAGALAYFKEKAAPLVPALRKALKDPESRVRHEAAWTLSHVGEAAKPAIPDLVRLFEGGTSDHRRALEKALVPLAELAAPAVVELLTRDDENLAEATERLLGRMGRPALPALVAAFSGEDERVRERAGEAMRRMGEPAVVPLLGLLGDESPDVRRNAAWRLGQLGRVALGAATDLTRALDDSDPTVVAQAAWALGEIGPAAREALPALQKLYDAGRHRAIVRDAMRKIRG